MAESTNPIHRKSILNTCLLTILFLLTSTAHAQQNPLAPLADGLTQLLQPLRTNTQTPHTLTLEGHVTTDKKQTPIRLLLSRAPGESLRLEVKYDKTAVHVQRTPQSMYIHRVDKNILFTSPTQKTTDTPHMLIADLTTRIGQIAPQIQSITNMLQQLEGNQLLLMTALLNVTIDAPQKPNPNTVIYNVRVAGKPVGAFHVNTKSNQITTITAQDGDIKVKLNLTQSQVFTQKPAPENATQIKVRPGELESSLAKGIRRAIEIQYDRYLGEKLTDGITQDEHGEMIIREGQRIVRLRGTPEQIGLQHGKFLKREARKIVDSTMYVVGTIYSLESGKWFLDEIRSARKRLDIHTPEEFRVELDALARGANIPEEELRLAAYFPALFHCSGFALAGDITKDGKLLHGRILDYMTGIGLEENAVVFVISKNGKTPFVNVGYAGFIGSVTGMNANQISLGEMGGRGLGDWDGISMPILMRMALEDAKTLQDAKDIFANNKRTCEYYYVFADGKDRTSVGVYATPQQITFLKPGQYHDLLPTPIPGCVLLSAGDRYVKLCQGVKLPNRKLNVQDAIRLMDAPVAMGNSNLHSVLFVPEDLELWVANAAASGPAYKQKFYQYNLKDLLSQDVASLKAK